MTPVSRLRMGLSPVDHVDFKMALVRTIRTCHSPAKKAEGENALQCRTHVHKAAAQSSQHQYPVLIQGDFYLDHPVDDSDA